MKKYTIKKEDVGKNSTNSVKIEGANEYPFTPLGYIQPNDVGRTCYKTGDDVWQVTN